MSSLYKRKWRLENGTWTEGDVWWVKYYLGGRQVRESTGTDNKQLALRFLKDREGRVATGQPILPRVDRIRYEEVAKDLRQHYQATRSRNLQEAESRFKHLDPFLSGRRIVGINQATITSYVLKRQGEGASNGSINRELGVLSRMLRLAYEGGKLLRMPIIRKLKENGPRQGFFEREQHEAVRRHLPADLQVAVAVAYLFGWRTQSKVLTLERRQLDLEEGRSVWSQARLRPTRGAWSICHLTLRPN